MVIEENKYVLQVTSVLRDSVCISRQIWQTVSPPTVCTANGAVSLSSTRGSSEGTHTQATKEKVLSTENTGCSLISMVSVVWMFCSPQSHQIRPNPFFCIFPLCAIYIGNPLKRSIHLCSDGVKKNVQTTHAADFRTRVDRQGLKLSGKWREDSPVVILNEL